MKLPPTPSSRRTNNLQKPLKLPISQPLTPHQPNTPKAPRRPKTPRRNIRPPKENPINFRPIYRRKRIRLGHHSIREIPQVPLRIAQKQSLHPKPIQYRATSITAEYRADGIRRVGEDNEGIIHNARFEVIDKGVVREGGGEEEGVCVVACAVEGVGVCLAASWGEAEGGCVWECMHHVDEGGEKGEEEGG